MRIMVKIVLAIALASVAVGGWAKPTPVTVGNITYVSGGVGDDEEGEMQATAKDYNLRLQFATKSGAYLAAVRVSVVDDKGKTVLDTVSDGPCLFAKLPDGAYNLSAVNKGESQKRAVSISGKGAATYKLFWSNEPAGEARDPAKEPPVEHRFHGCWK